MVKTKVFIVDPLNPDEEVLKQCCREIRSRSTTVVFPTETVYGLGAYIFDIYAVKRIFAIKERPIDNPLIVHISKFDHLYEVAEDIPDNFKDVTKKLWPGPITFILKKHREVPNEVSGGLPTIAVRMPAHPVPLRLIDCSGPIAAPSANISGRPSPTIPHHVYVDMFGRADMIIDGGETFLGVESTIVDLTTDTPKLLRPGPLPIEKLREILGKDIVVPNFAKGLSESNIALAPGTKYKHYAPKTPIVVVESSDYHDLKKYTNAVIEVIKNYLNHRYVIIASRETAEEYKSMELNTIVIGSRYNLYEIAKNLFKVLRDVDRMGVDIAIVEGFPEIGIGLAIMNRLRKASGYNIVRV